MEMADPMNNPGHLVAASLPIRYQKPVRCNLCNTMFPNKQARLLHECRSLTCSYCHKLFKKYANLQDHITTCTAKRIISAGIKCKFCEVIFANRLLREQHSCQKMFCSFCLKQFKVNKTFQEHNRKKHFCSLCDSYFDNLKLHYLVKHPDVSFEDMMQGKLESVMCIVCNSVMERDDVDEHMRSIHNILSAESHSSLITDALENKSNNTENEDALENKSNNLQKETESNTSDNDEIKTLSSNEGVFNALESNVNDDGTNECINSDLTFSTSAKDAVGDDERLNDGAIEDEDEVMTDFEIRAELIADYDGAGKSPENVFNIEANAQLSDIQSVDSNAESNSSIGKDNFEVNQEMNKPSNNGVFKCKKCNWNYPKNPVDDECQEHNCEKAAVTCMFCKKVFTRRHDVRRHLKQVHNQCETCEQLFPSKEAREIHSKYYCSDNPERGDISEAPPHILRLVKMGHCRYRSRSRSKSRSIPDVNKPLETASISSSSVGSPLSPEPESESLPIGPFSIPVTLKPQVKQEVASLDNVIQSEISNLLDQIESDSTSLDVDIQSYQYQVQPINSPALFLCDICQNGYSCRRFMQKHRDIIHFIRCGNCDVMFASHNALYNHVMESHKGRGSIVCKKCKMICYSYDGLIEHMSENHTETPAPEIQKHDDNQEANENGSSNPELSDEGNCKKTVLNHKSALIKDSGCTDKYLNANSDDDSDSDALVIVDTECGASEPSTVVTPGCKIKSPLEKRKLQSQIYAENNELEKEACLDLYKIKRIRNNIAVKKFRQREKIKQEDVNEEYNRLLAKNLSLNEKMKTLLNEKEKLLRLIRGETL